MRTISEATISALARNFFGEKHDQVFDFLAALNATVDGTPTDAVARVPAPMPPYSNCGELQPSADDYFELGRMHGWNDCRGATLHSLLADLPTIEQQRERFEEAIFTSYFISTIQHTGKGGPFELMPVGCKTKAEFLVRDDTGEYATPTVAAAWWAWRKATEKSTFINPAPEAAAHG